MPRPKLRKVAPSLPKTRVARPTIVPKSSEDTVEDISDEDHGTNAIGSKSTEKSVEIAQGTAQESQDQRDLETGATMEGAKRRRGRSMSRFNDAATSTEIKDVSRHISSLEEAASSSPDVEYGRKERSGATTENSMLAVGNFKRRARQPSILGRPVPNARSSSVESNLAEDTGLTNMPRMENSILARGTMRRRPRQPSILGRAHSRARSSSIGLEMHGSTPGPSDSILRPGHLRRRARQPSILGTSKKNQPSGAQDGYEEDEDQDDFNPEDESTPLNLSKTRSLADQSSQSASSSSSTNPLKRKRSPVPAANSPSQSFDDLSDEEAALHAQSETTQADPLVRYTTPEPLSDTMAPPRSSSPSLPTPIVHLTQRTHIEPSLRSTRRQPARKVQLPPPADSPPSSPPSLTHSPNSSHAVPVRQVKTTVKRTALSTVQLQALLPRRRRRPTRDQFEVDSSDAEIDVSGLASDDDELTNLSVRPTRSHRPTTTPARRVARLKPGPKTKSTSKAKKTYESRRNASDKENVENESAVKEDEEAGADDSLGPIADDPESENSQELEKRAETELEMAKRKFEAVDKWELDFEDMTASSSSPLDAR